MLTVDEYGRIRRAHRHGMSIREIARTLRHSRRKIRQVLAEPDSRLAINPYRHGRVEPRLVKRRRQRRYLTIPRAAARKHPHPQPLTA